MSKVIVLATPVFLLLIAIEFWVWRRRAGNATSTMGYGLSDAINSISLGMLSQLVGVLSRVFNIGIYSAVFASVAIWPDLAFWNSLWGLLLALVLYDFCYYWLHRAGHEVAVLWAAHVVHHQSQHYNLSTALRQTSSGALLGWIFYLPMALLGVPPQVFAIVALIDLLYQFWVHTELVGKLGWFDRVFCSPSNHRVHHAINTQYLDRNYGGVLVLWDRLFGTFAEEREACVYGTRSPLNSWDPLWANLKVYRGLLRDSLRTRRWADKIKVWLMPPGWLPDDLARHPERPRSDPADAFAEGGSTPPAHPIYNPPLTPGQQVFAILQFVLVLAAVATFLWHADASTLAQKWWGIAGIGVSIWGLGRFLEHRFSMLEVLLLECAVLATLASVPWMGTHGAFMVLKPLPMLLAMAWVWVWQPRLRAFDLGLLVALFFSLCGDVFLMLPGDFFIPGLASFLLAHGFYIALLRQGTPWLAHRGSTALVAAVSLTMAALLWPRLEDPMLRGAVILYIAVISLMVAQALGRASALQTRSARYVAAGAVLFMLSDSLIAINKFLSPIPDASLWILSSYFAAQMLIVWHLHRPQ